MRRIALAALVLCLLPVSPLLAADDSQGNGAQEKDDICALWDSKSKDELREEFKDEEDPERVIEILTKGRGRVEACRSTYWRAFEPKPVREMLDSGSFEIYERALDQGDCDTAFALFANAFPVAHPRAPNFMDDKEHFRIWKSSILVLHYPEMRFCRSSRGIREGQAEIERLGIVIGRYQEGWEFSSRRKHQSLPILHRNYGIASLIELDSYPPALLALARLSQEGKIVRFIPEYQYYLLQRLLLSGGERDQLTDMLAAAEATLQPSQMEDLKRQAQAGEYAGPTPTTE